MEENPKLRIKNCYCGNGKKLRNLVENFTSTTALHGVTYFKDQPSRKCNFVWKIMIAVCFIVVINSIYTLSYEALTKQSLHISTLNKDVKNGIQEDKNFPIYPGITICRMPPWITGLNHTMTSIVKYAYLAFGPPYVSLTAIEETRLLQIDPNEVKLDLSQHEKEYEDMRKRIPGFSMKRFLMDHSVKCEDMFISCILWIRRMNCCEIFKPVMTSMGMCFALSPTESFTETVISNQDFTYPFIIDMHSPPRGVEHMEEGFIVSIYDPVQIPVVIEQETETWVYPNSAAHVKVKLKMVRRDAVYSTWIDIGGNCPLMPIELQTKQLLRERSNIMLCFVKELERILRTVCNCSWLIHSNEAEDKSIEFCEPEAMYSCFFNITAVDSINECQDPCIEYSYESYSSSARLGGINVTRVDIRYDNDEYIYRQYHRFTISTFFSQIGGSLGLMLGASIITVLELILFITQWLWYRFIPMQKFTFWRNRVKTREPPSTEIVEYHACQT